MCAYTPSPDRDDEGRKADPHQPPYGARGANRCRQPVSCTPQFTDTGRPCTVTAASASQTAAQVPKWPANRTTRKSGQASKLNSALPDIAPSPSVSTPLSAKLKRGRAKPDGIPTPLANLLRQYVKLFAQPTSADASADTPSDAVRRQWVCYLPPQWLPQAERTSETAEPPSASPHKAPTSSRSSSTPAHRDSRPETDAAADPSTLHDTHKEKQQQLWFLLTHHPRDASACLSLSFSLCHTLRTMSNVRPPPLSQASTHTRNTATGARRSTDKNRGAADHGSPVTCPCGCLLYGCYIDARLFSLHEYYFAAIRRCRRANSAAPLQLLAPPEKGHDMREAAASVEAEANAPPQRLSFLPSATPPKANNRRGCTPSPQKGNAAALATQVPIDKDDTFLPDAEQQLEMYKQQDHTRRQQVKRRLFSPSFVPPPSPPPQPLQPAASTPQQQELHDRMENEAEVESRRFLASLQWSLQTELAPLLAIQPLAALVWRRTELDVAARVQLRCPRRRAHDLRNAPRNGGRGAAKNTKVCHSGTTQTAAPPLLQCLPGQKENVTDKASLQKPVLSFAASLGECRVSPGLRESVGHGEKRLWGVMTCVQLAWKQLLTKRHLCLFVPSLTVLKRPLAAAVVSSTAHAAPPSNTRTLSALQSAAVEMHMAPTALMDRLLHHLEEAQQEAQATASAPAYVHVYHRLRILLLSRAAEDLSDKPGRASKHQTATEEAAHKQFEAKASSSKRVFLAEELRHAELEFFNTVAWQTAQMPLWCRIALKAAQLYEEDRSRDRTTLRATASVTADSVGGRSSSSSSKKDEAFLSACEQSWRRLYVYGVRQLVRLLVRLMLLPALQADAIVVQRINHAPRGLRVGRRGGSNGAGDLTSFRRCRSLSEIRADANNARRKRRVERRNATGASTAAASKATAAAAEAATAAAPTTPVELSQLMLYHPLFGVAAAVASNAVSLSWATVCVVGTTNRDVSRRPTRESEVEAELTRLSSNILQMLKSAAKPK